MDADIENEINKIRWEGWRAKQNKEREKTYCYWSEPWNEWSDVGSPSGCVPDHACDPSGLCMFCAQTLHEAECVSAQKGTFLASAWGAYGIPPCEHTGGRCWAEAEFSRSLQLPSAPKKFVAKAKVVLNGKLWSNAGSAKLFIYIKVAGAGIEDEVYSAINNREWHTETFWVQTQKHSVSSGGYYDIQVRIHGWVTTIGPDGAGSDAVFNNRYGDGFYVKVLEIGVDWQ